MIIAITRFSLKRGVDLDQLRAEFSAAASLFEDVPGLVRKHFLIARNGRTVGDISVRKDRHAASRFLTAVAAPFIFQKFGVEPTVEFFDVPFTVKNGTRLEPKQDLANILRDSPREFHLAGFI